MTQDFILAKLAVLTWRCLYLLKMRICNFFLSYDQKCSPFDDLTNVSHNLQSLSLVQSKVCTPFTSYTHYLHISGSRFWSSTATLSYKPLWRTVWWSLHLATALLHHSTSHVSTVLLYNLDRDSRGTLTFCPVVNHLYVAANYYPTGILRHPEYRQSALYMQWLCLLVRAGLYSRVYIVTATHTETHHLFHLHLIICTKEEEEEEISWENWARRVTVSKADLHVLHTLHVRSS